MLFNSLSFLLFFPAICALYWALRQWGGSRSLRARNLLLLLGSYYFYMCWQPRYALLLFASTGITYAAARLIERSRERSRKRQLLALCIVANVALLFFYKYYAFAADALAALLKACGIVIHVPGFDVLLPVGISFYIFQALGYAIDVYRGQTRAERDFPTYALFVSFFPQLVAGPIERSYRLLPQFKEDRPFHPDFALSGFRLMLWGYFLKLCVADSAAVYVDEVFNNLSSHPGYSALVASIMFSLQIYGDFAGYSYIAIGAARILGFSLCDNFLRPYFAASVTDFWRRWHISLSTWLRDYIYIPLGGSRRGAALTYRNLLVTFAVSGLWHGANWTFLLWGMLHGAALCFERLLGLARPKNKGMARLAQMAVTWGFVCLAWVVFRAESLRDAAVALSQIFNSQDFTLVSGRTFLLPVAVCGSVVLAKEVAEEMGWQCRKPWITNYVWPIFLLVCIGLLGVVDGGEFIYFQF